MATKSLTYKIARFNVAQESMNLYDLLTAALKMKKSAASRKREVEGNSSTLINYHGTHKGLRVAELINYTAGQRQPFAKIDDKADTLELSSLAPPDNKSEFLQNILYFGTIGNSVIISQSLSLRSQQLEDYLNWLLTDTKLLKDGQLVQLSDHPPLDKDKAITTAKHIEFNAPVALTPVAPPGAQEVSYYKPDDVGWELLKKLLPTDFKLPGKLKASDIVGTGELNVSLKLSWARDNKKDSTGFMDSISNALRHIDDEVDYSIMTRSGLITKNELKLKRPVSVKTDDKGFVQKDDMWSKMESWLAELIEQKRIDLTA